ncbi:hypothetical protein FHS85_001826 [Rhodoligotrophos appendicifer]|uniref:hypothetical protein n=1 Tax=Rhodoligotrophos appendicifer TaxID=987056 RepID=UPI00118588A6|nr:hypothetical protein [Rhodoligotrophos appendicifer]
MDMTGAARADRPPTRALQLLDTKVGRRLTLLGTRPEPSRNDRTQWRRRAFKVSASEERRATEHGLFVDEDGRNRVRRAVEDDVHPSTTFRRGGLHRTRRAVEDGLHHGW